MCDSPVRNIKLSIFTLTLLVCFSSAELFAYQRPSKTFKDGLVQTAFTIENFSSVTNYNNNGEGVDLSNLGANFTTTSADLYSRYVFSPSWATYLVLNVTGSESNDGVELRSNSGVTGLDLGADLLLMRGFVDLVASGEFRMPFSRVSETTDTVMISEGESHVLGTLQLQKRTQSYSSYVWLGINHRDEGRSLLMPYGIGQQFLFSKFSVGAELNGFSSLSEDESVTKSIVTDRVNAGSLKYYSTNPSVMIIEGNFKYRFSNSVNFTGGAGTTLAGANTSYGHHFYAGVELSWQAYSRHIGESKREKHLREFKESTSDGVDQSLFEDENLSEELK